MDVDKLSPEVAEWLAKPIFEPRDFVRATWRGAIPVNRRTGDEIGFSLDTLNGTQRFVLPLHDARRLAETLLGYIDQHAKCSRNISVGIDVQADGLVVCRAYEDGRLDATYAAVPTDAALMVIEDLIRGREPPRGLYRRDVPPLFEAHVKNPPQGVYRCVATSDPSKDSDHVARVLASVEASIEKRACGLSAAYAIADRSAVRDSLAELLDLRRRYRIKAVWRRWSKFLFARRHVSTCVSDRRQTSHV